MLLERSATDNNLTLGKWKVVVLDEHSRKLIEHVMPLSAFYDENVTGPSFERSAAPN